MRKQSRGRSRSQNRSEQKRKSGKVIIPIVAGLVVTVCAVFWIFGPKNGGDEQETNMAVLESTMESLEESRVTGPDETSEIAEPESSEAETTEAAVEWKLELMYGSEQVSVARPKGLEDFEANRDSIKEQLTSSVASATAGWETKPVSPQLSGRNEETGQWTYSDGVAGKKVNTAVVVEQIMSQLKEGRYANAVSVEPENVYYELSTSQIKEQYDVIGTYKTTATSNENRNNNITLAMKALDGLVIKPGEEFSFNKTTGNRTIARGYKAAGAYRNGEFVEEPGGGVCQVSSTLYNALVFSGITIKERNPHSYEPSYVVPGEDSMVSYDGYSGPDLRFVNNQDTSVAIRAVFKDRVLTISIVGVPILEEGVTVSMRSEKIKTYDPPAPNYVKDLSLPPRTEKVVKEGSGGTMWKTYLVTSKDGTVISETVYHNTTYKGKAAVIKRNDTDQTTATQATETAGSAEKSGSVGAVGNAGAIGSTGATESADVAGNAGVSGNEGATGNTVTSDTGGNSAQTGQTQETATVVESTKASTENTKSEDKKSENADLGNTVQPAGPGASEETQSTKKEAGPGFE